MSATAEALRLNLGCSKTRVPGFLNFDINPAKDVDLVGDIRDLSQFADGSVADLLASNVLEHISHTQTLACLKEWRRVLASGGKLWLSVPDFDAVIRLYKYEGLNEYLKNLIWGEQDSQYGYHYICFTWPNLRLQLDQAGFKDAKRVKFLPFGLADASALHDNIENKPTAINVEVTA